MLVRFFIVVLVLAVILLTGAVLLPANVHVERHITIEQPPSIVYGVLSDLHHFQAWSPWLERDPEARYTFSGAERGVGSRLSWDGDPRQVGRGWQEITLAQPYSRVRTHLDFSDQGKAEAYFDIRPAGHGTRVVWGFDTDVTEDRSFFGALMGKYMGLFVNHWVGKDYEQGLESLKQYAESFPGSDYADLDIQEVDVPAQTILLVSSSSGKSDDAIAAARRAAYGEISRFMNARGLEYEGQPLSISYSSNPNSYEFDAAIPISDSSIAPSGNIKIGHTPSGKAVKAIHQGPHSSLDATYEMITAYVAVQRLNHSGVSWEHYISDPGSTPANQLITHVYFMLDE
jgi:effector-binding domain-containing protein